MFGHERRVHGKQPFLREHDVRSLRSDQGDGLIPMQRGGLHRSFQATDTGQAACHVDAEDRADGFRPDIHRFDNKWRGRVEVGPGSDPDPSEIEMQDLCLTGLGPVDPVPYPHDGIRSQLEHELIPVADPNALIESFDAPSGGHTRAKFSDRPDGLAVHEQGREERRLVAASNVQ